MCLLSNWREAEARMAQKVLKPLVEVVIRFSVWSPFKQDCRKQTDGQTVTSQLCLLTLGG